MKNQYSSILEESATGYWIWNTVDDSFYISPAFKKMLGFEDNILPNTFDSFKKLILPEDAEYFFQRLHEHTASSGKVPFVVKVRYQHSNTTIIDAISSGWVNDWGEDGKHKSIVGYNINWPSKTLEKDLQNADEQVVKPSFGVVGGWEVNFITNKVTWTNIAKQIFEVEDSYEPTLEKAMTFYKGLSLERLEAAFENLVTTGTSYNIEVDMITAKGKNVLLRTIGYAVIHNGKCTRSYGTVEDVRAQKNANEHSTIIFEGSTNAHLLFDETGIIDCNNAAIKMIGCKDKAELLSYHPTFFSPEYQPDGQRSDQKFLEMDRIAFERGINCFEWLHKKTDGQELLVEVTLTPVKLAGKTVLLVVWHDITERSMDAERLKKSEALLNETQQLTHSGSWERNLLTGLNIWSAESFRIFGLSPASTGPEIDVFAQMIHPDDMKMYIKAVKNAIHDKISSDFELRIILKDGSTKWIRAIGKPFINNLGIVTKLHGAISDISIEKGASEALRKAKEQAEQAAIAKSQFLTTMSHEIRTPMNAVIGFTHLLIRNAREDQMEFLKILKFSGENLLVLINDILDFSKIEAGKIVFEEVDFNLQELMGNIKSALMHKAKSKGLKLRLLIDDDAPDFVKGDPVRLGQIITNLASNAVKFTTTGSVSISALITSQDRDFTTIYFEVKDTGIGIPDDMQDNIYESFTQASSDTTRKFGGTGLGLTITKRLLELMDSRINLKSKLGEGSVFSFELKLKNSNTKMIVRENAVVPDYKKNNLKNIKLLIADDNHINILLAQELLRQWEGECDVAENGLLALELVKINDYDMVLMDLQMPEMDGYRATEEIRKLKGEKYKTLPIVALTASAMLEIKDKAYTSGMNDYISKPFNPDELYRKIIKFTGNKIQAIEM